MSPWWFVHTLPAERLHEEPRSQAHAGSLSHPVTSPIAPPRHAWAERPPSKRRPARLQEHGDRGNPAVSFVRLVTVTALSVNISIHKGEVGKVRVSPAGWSPEPPVEFVGRGGPCWPQSGAEHSLSSPRPETKWQPSNSNYSKNVTFCGELIEFTPL